MTSFSQTDVEKKVIDISWDIAKNLFGSDQLQGPAVLLFHAGDKSVRIFVEGGVGYDLFKKNLIKAAAEKPFTVASYISHVNFQFDPLPDGTRPVSDYDVILLVATTDSGSRLVQSAKISLVDGVLTLQDPVQAHISAALVVDELVAMTATVH